MFHNQLQQQCWQYLWNTYPESRYCMWHTKNEDIPRKGETKKEYIIRRSQDKAIGLLPGVWDFTMYFRGILYIFEIKVGQDTLSDAQIRFQQNIVRHGGQSYVIHDLETFKKIVDSIFHAVKTTI